VRAIALLSALHTALAFAQNGGASASSIRGTVRNAQHQPVADAAVTLRADSHAPNKTARTDQQGHFQFPALAPGVYTLEAQDASSAAAYGPLTLQSHESKAIDLMLLPAATAQDTPFYEQPKFAEAGVSQASGGSHGSDPVRRQTADLTRATAALATDTDRSKDDSAESAFFSQGSQLLSRDAFADATKVFTRGAAAFPDSARMHMGLGVAEFATASYKQAAREICRASDLDPANPAPYMFLGRMADLEEFRSPEVSARLAHFAQLKPKNPWANYYAGLAAWRDRQGDDDPVAFARASSLLENAIALDPNHALANLRLGTMYESRKQLARAASAYAKAIAIDPSLAEAHYRLAQVDRQLGKTADAQRELEIHQKLMQAAAAGSNESRNAVNQFVRENQPTQSPQPK
jgi:tetratricopeptide (TPR) repeat protein